MSRFVLLGKIMSIVAVLCFAKGVLGQTEASSEKKLAAAVNAAPEIKTTTTVNNPADKKMVSNATINLQTTVTGNQEQPRVLYILPWQSPATDAVDFETFDSQQKAVFGHVEREELRRELESSAE